MSILLVNGLHFKEQESSGTSPIWLHVRISWVAVQSKDATPKDFYLIGLGCALGIEILSSLSNSNVQPSWGTSIEPKIPRQQSAKFK